MPSRSHFKPSRSKFFRSRSDPDPENIDLDGQILHLEAVFIYPHGCFYDLEGLLPEGMLKVCRTVDLPVQNQRSLNQFMARLAEAGLQEKMAYVRLYTSDTVNFVMIS